MKIFMHEVNFGESILYQEGDYKLLVDCGAKCGRKGHLACERVENKIDDNTQLLITHFDEDHYNGIIQMPNTQKFNTIYLPLYIYAQKKLRNTEEMFIDVIKTWTYLIAAGKRKKINVLHSLFIKLPELVNSVYDIRCIGSGDQFFLEQRKVNVLWPHVDYKIRQKMYTNEILQKLRDNITNEQDKDLFEGFVTLADEYVKIFLDIYKFYCSNGSEDIAQDITEENFSEKIKELKQTYEKLSKYPISIVLDKNAKTRINSVSSCNIKNMNECSVIFEIDNEVIAFGDATERIIRYIASNRFSYNKYKVLKVQHHGTESYWSGDLPDANIYMISNSGTDYLKWSIYKEYKEDVDKKICCTNDTFGRCENYNSDRRCAMCNVDIGKSEIMIDCSKI